MKQSSKGQKSSRNLIALFFLLSMLSISFGGLYGNALTTSNPDPNLLRDLEVWTASVILENAGSNPQIAVQLLADPSEYSCIATYDPSSSTLLVEATQLSNSSQVPIDLAFVEVGIKNTPGYYQIEVKSDGGAIVLVIDEF